MRVDRIYIEDAFQDGNCMSIEETRIRLHRQIENHAKLCVAQVQMEARAAKDFVAHAVAWHNRSIGQRRRFENQLKFNRR